MGAPVVHWEIVSPNAAQLQKFYGELFDWHVDTNNPMGYGMVDTHGEGGINGGIGSPQGGAPGHFTMYVQVDDLQKYLDRAESLGAKTIMPPMEIPGDVTIALFADPDGRVIGLVKGM